MTGILIGAGVGPGDPELITMKSWKAIQMADVISFVANEQGESQAKTIAVKALAGAKYNQIFMPVKVPMCDDRTLVNTIYDKAAQDIEAYLNAGKKVVFLCEGDPLFFGSFAYLLERLQTAHQCQVIPGISSVHAASSVLQKPLAMLKESFAVISGRHTEQQLIAALKQHDSVVIMKAGRSRKRIIDALIQSGRSHEANYLEYIGRENQRVITDITELEDEVGPYFSLFVVNRQQRDRS